jgi:4-amino-4-deoxy-L-arabinose transferase-like glycosyltransferase
VRRPVATLLLLCLLTFLVGLGRPAITDSDEAFYAEAAREMVESGDWLTPHFNYEDRWQKPVLYYWLTAATFLVTGPTEWGARVWSALSGVGLVLMTWSAGRSLTGSTGIGWLSGAITATSLGYSVMARAALPDLPLTFGVTLGIWAGLRTRDGGAGWWALAGLGVALGFLFKGPVAIVIPAIVLLPIAWRDRGRGITLRGLATAAAVFAVVGLPWYGAMLAEHGLAYAQSFFIGDNLERFATDRFNEPRPIWFYLPVLLGGLLPWSPALVAVSIGPARALLRRRRTLTDEEWRLLIWALMPLLFYTLSVGKQPRYILPVLPPLAILLAAALHGRTVVDDHGSQGRQPALLAAAWATAALFGTSALVLARVQPVLPDVRGWSIWIGVAGLALAGMLLGGIAARRRWRALPGALVGVSVLLALTLQFTVFGQRRPEPVERMADLVRMHRAAEPIGVHRAFVRNLVFYTGARQVDLFDDAQVVDFLRSSERVLLVAPTGRLSALEQASGLTLRRLGEVSYVNTANFRLRTLLRPDPSREIERVVLVANR